MTRTFGVINAESTAAKQAVAGAGLDLVYIAVNWTSAQPGGEGTALSTSAMDNINGQIDDARAAGLAVCLAHSAQYTPAWVQDAVEPFRDQHGVDYLSTGSGKQVRNWFWTQHGRDLIADFYTKVYAALTVDNRAAVQYLKFGGGYYGEISYPAEVGTSPNWRYYGFGPSMQTGTGLAAGLEACPLPGYTPFTGTDAQDVQWINWYLRGVESFVRFSIDTLRAAGWTQPLYAMHPSFSVRNNQGRGNNGWRQNFAQGVDFTRAVGVYKNDRDVWPWNTWLAGMEGWTPNTFDSDQAAWKKMYAVAAARGKHYRLGGENTGQESNTRMDEILAEAFGAGGPSTGPIYTDGRPRTGWLGYHHFQWLHYANLTAGGSHATLAHYGTAVDPYRSS